MGSDTSPEVLLSTLIEVSAQLKEEASFVAFGPKTLFPSPSSIDSVFTSQIIEMDDDPLLAVRKKKDSSMYRGLEHLRAGKLDGFISAGNTGALLASAKILLPMLQGIQRPALLALLPTKQRPMAVIDVGANVSFKEAHLVQFTLMGVAYQKSRGIAHPTVGLLNIGTEAKKGTPELRKVYSALQHLVQQSSPSSFLFVGNVEGKDVFQGHIDVLVTDGFTGNVFLKTAEGIAAFLLDELQNPFLNHDVYSWRHRLYHAEHPGALLCGVEGIVVKCHGDLSPPVLASSLKSTVRLVRHGFLHKIKSELAAL